MPALDRYHAAVQNALVKDGWTITDDPLTLRVGPDRIHIDIAAERLIIAEKGVQRIALHGVSTLFAISSESIVLNAFSQSSRL